MTKQRSKAQLDERSFEEWCSDLESLSFQERVATHLARLCRLANWMVWLLVGIFCAGVWALVIRAVWG